MKLNHPTPSQILHAILDNPDPAYKTKTYVVLGRPGPTGKTWLCEKLKLYGYKVVEISEHIFDLVEYYGSTNHYRDYSDHDTVVVIVLNRYLQRPKETE